MGFGNRDRDGTTMAGEGHAWSYQKVGTGKNESVEKVAKEGFAYGDLSSGKGAEQGFYATSGLKKKASSGSRSPSDILADITNKDWENYQKDFAPVETALTEEIAGNTAERAAAKSASSDAGAAFDRGRARFERRVSRTGLTLNKQQRTATDKSAGLARGKLTAGAANLARRGQKAQDTATRTDMILAGQGLRGQALQGLGQAATMDSQRTQAGKQMEAQAQQNTMSNIGTMAGIGASVGGPWGAVVGAGVGLISSLF